MKTWHSNKSPDYLRVVGTRILSSTEQRGSCLIWTGKERAGGYGRMRVNGKLALVHRLIYRIYVGEIPDGSDVLHTCDTPLCISVGHLFLGDHADNMADKAKKGRAPSKLTSKQIAAIDAALRRGESGNSLSIKYGVAPSTIYDIRDGVTWRHVTKRSRSKRRGAP